MRHSFCILIILLLFSRKLIGQSILNQYDFSKGEYYVCLLEGPMGKDRGIPVCPVSDRYAIDTISFFYTSDTVILSRLKKELVLYQRRSKNGIAYILQCGYPFWFCIFKEGKLLLKLPANIDCGYMETSMGQMVFRSKTLKQYKNRFKPLLLRYTCFNSDEERRKFIESIKEDSNYVSYKVLANPSFF